MHPTLGIAGTKGKCYIEAVVCLGLLCALLLTVIVWRVIHHITEKEQQLRYMDQQQLIINSLTQDMNQLQLIINHLTQDRNLCLERNNNLTAEFLCEYRGTKLVLLGYWSKCGQVNQWLPGYVNSKLFKRKSM